MNTPKNSDEDSERLLYSAMTAIAVVGGALGAGYCINAQQTNGTEYPEGQTTMPSVPSASTPADAGGVSEQPLPELTAEEIKTKILKSLVILEFGDSQSGGRKLCTGFVPKPRSVVTARHCTGINIRQNLESIQLPNLIEMHAYPSDSKQLVKFNNSDPYVWFAIPNELRNPDFVEIRTESEVFSDYTPLRIAGKISENDKYYAVHYTGVTNPHLPLGKWAWRIDEGKYLGVTDDVVDHQMTYHEIQMRMPHIQHGNSGSPVLNQYGEVAGVLTAVAKENVNTVSFVPFSATDKNWLEKP